MTAIVLVLLIDAVASLANNDVVLTKLRIYGPACTSAQPTLATTGTGMSTVTGGLRKVRLSAAAAEAASVW